jgi:lipopolysaccharide assembly outer membrane protein LptD (OstA)
MSGARSVWTAARSPPLSPGANVVQFRTELAWQAGGILFYWPRSMTKFPAIFALSLCAAIFSPAVFAQDDGMVMQALHEIIPGSVEGQVHYNFDTGTMTGTNGIYLNYKNGEVVLTADSASANPKTGDVDADGNVRIESGNQLWVGEHIHYNFINHQIRSEQFRTGRSPVFAAGAGLTGYIDPKKGATNQVSASRAFVTTDDYSNPAYQIRASTVKVIPGKSVQMWNAVAYVEGVPVFYFPYYERNLGARANNFTATPGYRSRYGEYLLNTYNWYLGDVADGKIRVDYRDRRGPGLGPDVNLHLGRWGEATIRYYYVHDSKPNYSTNAYPAFGNIPEDRQRFYLGWQATPATNLNLKAQVNYQSDPLFLHDFFEGYYTANPQPNTFIEANQYWDNWSLDALATPRVNDFFSQVERLPDVKLTGFRQQVFGTPVYYDSESSVGWYRDWAANMTNGLYPGTNGIYVVSAARADTYHQLTLPWTFFNWLNVTPRVGGRLTYYSSQNLTNGAPNNDVFREVFNTGVGVSFKASSLWADATNSFLQVDGLRHIIEPSANYVFVPDPSVPPAQLPPFDAEIPSLMLSPVLFPDYNSIDSIDTMNVIRFGLRNILQTKRGGELDDLVNWNVLLDWRLDPKPGQSPLNDLYSAFVLRPRSWITAESQIRYDLNHGYLNLAFHQLTFTPNDRWSWGISHWYLRSGFIGPNENNFIASTFFLRVNDNWGLRATHSFNAESGRLQEQTYTVYRDLRSWTAALSFRVEDNAGSSPDFTVAFSFSLKANPSVRVGEDAVNSYHLVGD